MMYSYIYILNGAFMHILEAVFIHTLDTVFMHVLDVVFMHGHHPSPPLLHLCLLFSKLPGEASADEINGSCADIGADGPTRTAGA